jgi:sortase (surface protein transpeptidase)
VPAFLAIVLALLGVLAITMAACSSRPGAPQPSASAAGVIDGETSGSTSVAAVSTGSAQSSTAAQQTAGSKSSAKPGTSQKSAGGATPPSTAPTPVPTSNRTAPSKKSPIVVPSFGSQVKGPILEASPPVSLAIPALGVKSPLLDLGLNPDGTVQVPSLDDPASKAGWYRNSPTPGSIGPAILLGHIDSKKYGPGVFYKLGNLQPGQEVDVTRRDGVVAVFKVDGVRTYPKNQFPTKTIYSNIDHAGLRMITCGGTFDPDKGSYESNIVVFASLVSSHRA